MISKAVKTQIDKIAKTGVNLRDVLSVKSLAETKGYKELVDYIKRGIDYIIYITYDYEPYNYEPVSA